jgi:hypothetical protein
MTMPSSNVLTVTGSVIADIVYLPDSVRVSQGEAHGDAPTITRDGDKWTLTLQADRNKTSAVAKEFDNKTGSGLHQYAYQQSGSPDQLNFFFGTTITLAPRPGGAKDSGSKVIVYFGQGSHDDINNWWMGGNAVVNRGAANLVVSDDRGRVTDTIHLEGGVSSFVFSAG